MRNISLKAVLLSSLVAGWNLQAAKYQEVNGYICIEAEHFDSRTAATDDPAAGPFHEWKIVPDEVNPTPPYKNARGDKYMRVLPDGGQNRNSEALRTAGPYMEYKIDIKTTGDYKLYLRATGFDDASDSLYASMVELEKANGGAGPDWFRQAPDPTDADFATKGVGAGRSNLGGAEVNGGGAGGDPMIWTISKAGTYTFRIWQLEDGNGVDAFILQLKDLPTPAQDAPESPIAGTEFILITKQPQDVTVGAGGTATFTVAAGSSGTNAYQWQRAAPGSSTYTNIAGATSDSFTTTALNPADSGTQYRVNISITGKSATSRTAIATVDSTPPTVAKAVGSANFNAVTVTFSEPVTAATGGNEANYSLSGGLTISDVTLSSDGRAAVLKTSKQTSGTVYTLTVKDIEDVVTPANVISPNPAQVSFTAFVFVTGAVGFETWLGITGTAVDGLTSDPRFPDNPDFVATATALDTRTVYPDDSHENYGGRLRTILIPSDSASYNFFLRSDDASQLFLSNDDSFANLAQIAEEIDCCNAFMESGVSQTSTLIPLQKGKKYALQVLWKAGTGEDYAQVAWRKEGDATPAGSLKPLRGDVLNWYANPDVKLEITQNPQNQTAVAGGPVTFSVRYVAESFQGTNASVQWQKNGVDIAGATAQDYTIPFVDPADNGAKFHAVVFISSLASKTSTDATLTVTPDTTAPTIKTVQGTLAAVSILFSEPLDATTANDKANYAIDQGVVVTSASLATAVTGEGLVSLAISGANAGTNYTLTVNGVKDRSGNAIAPNTKVTFAPTSPAKEIKFVKLSLEGTTLTMTWTGGGTLEAADKVDGPYTAVPGKLSDTFKVDIASGGQAKFYRVRGQ